VTGLRMILPGRYTLGSSAEENLESQPAKSPVVRP
jgi:hypothetical protein